MTGVSPYSDETQRLVVTTVMNGVDWVNMLEITPKPTQRTVRRWIKKWKPILEEQFRLDKIRQDKDKIGHKKDKIGQHNGIDLRDLKDEFVLYIKTLNPDDFTTPRDGTIKRIKNQNRYAFTHGTIDLLQQYLKIKKLKVIEKNE